MGNLLIFWYDDWDKKIFWSNASTSDLQHSTDKHLDDGA